MLKYKLLIKLSVLSCMLICCVYGDTIQVDVVVCLLVTLSTVQHNQQTQHHHHHQIMCTASLMQGSRKLP
jgi:hypothetical protein